MLYIASVIRKLYAQKSFSLDLHTQQTLSMGSINISLQTLTISCDYLQCRVITICLHWIISDIIQIYLFRFVFLG